MEDCNALISDCIILSCCCQCLILQLIVFVFFRAPRKVARKMKEYAKRKLRKKWSKRQSGDHVEIVDRKQRVEDYYYEDDDDDEEFNMTLRILELEGIGVNELHKWGSCIEEVDKVFGGLSLKGEFGFGSFWGRNYSEIETRKCYCECSKSLKKEEDDLEYGSHVVKFHLIEVIGPFSS